MGGGLGITRGAPVFVCRSGLLWGGALEQHTGPQSLFAGGGCCGRGALEQHTGPQSLFAGQAQSNIQGFVLFVRLVI